MNGAIGTSLPATIFPAMPYMVYHKTGVPLSLHVSSPHTYIQTCFPFLLFSKQLVTLPVILLREKFSMKGAHTEI